MGAIVALITSKFSCEVGTESGRVKETRDDAGRALWESQSKELQN